MGSVIASHNQIIIQPTSNNHGCNCRNRAKCPLDDKGLMVNIVYKAVVSQPSKPDNKYFGISETSFKDRFRNHTRDFCHKKYVNSTELSKCMWKLKDEKIKANIKWNIMSIVHGPPKGGVCKLCLTEIFWILKHFNNKHLFNQKLQFISTCRDENKLLNQLKRGSFICIYIAVSF